MADFFEGEIKIDIDLASLSKIYEEKAKHSFAAVADELEGRFTDAISSAYWQWPGPSKRGVSGSTLGEKARSWSKSKFNTGSPRSIVDSGDLKGSLRVDLNLNNLTCQFMWTTSYAAAVHEGAYIHPWGDKKNAKVHLPARPWTSAVINGTHGVPKYDYVDRFSRFINQ
ncbi:predicted protein [Cyanophage PSS2]|uniref:hypothetical protein n=1 Tax=Cyanophage PSS2 TaxID=658401 RepID=UPI0001B04015|nr:hypothetical protein PSS2_gp063 [Cyanophage PSS2]ACT65625.1 hypothetical protein [Cyanophage PSS2]ACY75766.1 predicted protein [Cyanophage PSS2]